ncbi:MAG: VWA domain-containing protein [Prevotellaceae bacterium]|nr:VWA domain-containing protein [Prevotellaceae bacterium]
MRFEDPTYLYLLILVPLMVVAHYIFNIIQSRRMRRFGEAKAIRQLINASSSSIRLRREIKFWLLAAALTCIIFMLARPQLLGAAQQRTDNRQGIEMMVCLDVSNSMLAEDVAPSRMDKCKMMLEDLIDEFGNNKIGLIVFAGDAFIQLPLTADYVSAKMFLNNINPGMIQTQGTDIARAIDISSHSFSKLDGIGRGIVIITDGEDHEGGAVEAAKAARKHGMKTYVLGVGSTKGAPIPMGGSYLTDEKGETVITRLNEAMCKEVANAGGGKYIHVDNTNIAQHRLSQAMSSLARQDIETSVYTERSEQFQAFALMALIFLIIEICIQERRVILRRLHLFNPKTALVLLLLLSSTTVIAQNDRAFNRRGNRDFRSGKYDKAEVNYRKSLEKNESNPQATYNLGNALLYQNKDSLAMVQYNKALQVETDPKRQAQIYHNIGVICQRQKDFGQAIEAYKQSLRRNPSDDETRYNLVLCQKQLKDDKNNQNQNNKDKNKNDQNKDNNKDQNNYQNKDKNKDQNKDDNKDKNQNKDNQQQNNNQQPKQELSKENAEQLLNAAMQQEKATQDKMKAVRGSNRRLQKNW